MTISGGDELEALGHRLVGAGSLREEMQTALRVVAEDLVKDARASAREHLPKKGGLNVRVADDPMVIQDRASAAMAGVRIGTTTSDTRGANRGVIRHPVFGHRDRFVAQTYEPGRGWFDNAMDAGKPKIAAALAAAAEAYVARMLGGL